MKSGFPAQRANLVASTLALAIASLGVAAGLWYCQQLERRYIHAIAPEFTTPKLQGVALQREAFSQSDLLVLYGSSELAGSVPTNAIQFFQDFPTGFRVFPVGKPGATSLAILQKVAAVGEDLHGRKVACSISPSFFFKPDVDPHYYGGSFSALQAGELAFSPHLSSELKRDVARRMLEFPATLEGKPLLQFSLQRLAGDTMADRLMYAAAWPLGKLQNGVGRAQDHVEAALDILEQDEKLNPEPKRGLRRLNWNDILKNAAKFVNSAAVQSQKNLLARNKIPKASRDKVALQTLANADEFRDFELLMRTFKELGAKPLILSMPLENIRLEVSGYSGAPRNVYVQRIDELVDRYDYPLVEFRDHEKELGFFDDFHDHLSGKGWLYYNKALDDFFHGRISSL